MFRFELRHGLSALAVCGAILAFVPGCGGSSRAYTPNAASAREALDLALAAWQKGGKADQLATASPQVHVVDSQWQAGKVLEGYEIIEEQAGAAETEKRYSVLLKLKKPEGEQRVEYIMVGREPLWIFRDDDYAKAGNMGDDTKPQRRVRRR
ncbi:MAG: hypothetical protein P4L84_11575 [Isosphaeraceae bacterium]|nr:hypothetical protein [Isosphaeraceae bacterium]